MTFLKSVLCTSTIVIVGALPALACPTGADLTNGIRVTEGDGTTNDFRSLRSGVVQQDGRATDGYTYRTLLGQGVHILQLADTENGALIQDTVYSTAYPTSPGDLPIPTPGSRWEVDTSIRSVDEIYAEAQTQAWGNVVPFTIGDCTYDAIPGKVDYISDGFHIKETLMFMPDLGFALLMVYEDVGYDVTTFTYADIAPL